MQTQELYLPMLIGLWTIFIGIALVIIGFVDKKASITNAGWAVLFINGLISAYFNLFQIDLSTIAAGAPERETAQMLIASGWLNLAGSLLSAATLLFFHFKRKRYLLMAILTILFFAIQFFQFYGLIQKPK